LIIADIAMQSVKTTMLHFQIKHKAPAFANLPMKFNPKQLKN
jgi:hypothetical protein